MSRDTVPVVGNRDVNIIPPTSAFRTYPYLSPFGYCVEGIEQQVEENLTQGLLVAVYRRQVAGDFQQQLGSGESDLICGKVRRPLQQLGKIHLLSSDFTLSGKIEEIPDDLLRSLCLFNQIIDHFQALPI